MKRNLFKRKDERKALVIKGVDAKFHEKIKALAAYWGVPMHATVRRLVEVGLEHERVQRALKHMEQREPF